MRNGRRSDTWYWSVRCSDGKELDASGVCDLLPFDGGDVVRRFDLVPAVAVLLQAMANDVVQAGRNVSDSVGDYSFFSVFSSPLLFSRALASAALTSDIAARISSRVK